MPILSRAASEQEGRKSKQPECFLTKSAINGVVKHHIEGYAIACIVVDCHGGIVQGNQPAAVSTRSVVAVVMETFMIAENWLLIESQTA